MRRSMIQIDGDASEDDDDISFESDGDGRTSFDYGAADYGRGGVPRGGNSFSSYGGGGFGGRGGDVGDFDAGAGDAYAFDLNFDTGKASRWDADGLDLDGGPMSRKPAAATTGSSMGARSVAKPAAKSQNSTFGTGAGKLSTGAGAGAKTSKVNLDDKFDLGRFNIDRKPSKQAAPKPAKEDFEDLDAFLNASDSDDDAPKTKPTTSAVSNTAREKASAIISAAAASDSEEDSAAPSPVAAAAPAAGSALKASDSPRSARSEGSEGSMGSDPSPYNFQKQDSPMTAGSSTPPAASRLAFRANASESEKSSYDDQAAADRPPSVSSVGSSRSARRENRSSSPPAAPPATTAPVTTKAEQPTQLAAAVAGKDTALEGAAALLSRSSAPGAKLAAAVVANSYSAEEVSSVMSPRQATGTYTEDFAGESTNQALQSQQPAVTTYDDDFELEADANEEPSASASATPPVTRERQEQEAMMQRLKELEAQMTSSKAVVPSTQAPGVITKEPEKTAAATTTTISGVSGIAASMGTSQVEVAPVRQSRRPVRSDSDDDDYRPRRPTCHKEVQVSIPVDVGVQCDPPPPDPRPPDDPFGAWMQAAAAAHSAQTGVGSQPSMFGPAYGGLPAHFGGMPPSAAAPPVAPGAYGGMPYGLPWYPYPGPPGYGMYPQAFAGPPQGPSPVLRQLFSAAVGSGPRGASYLGRPREAWGPNPGAPGEPTAADSASGPASMPTAPGVPGDAASTAALMSALGMGGHASYPGFGPQMAAGQDGHGSAYSAPPPAAPAGVPPMALALGMVNSSFQEPIHALRQAVERHRALLEKRLPPEAIGPGPAGSRE
mmetsp:Transcript_97729/g.173221  ORF Transcript_97729/g.173221 Transcript_97729/m.173221 type:complete len:831 (-) Transcript_97729:134-2626(-)